MPTISNDRYVRYVLENLEDVKAVLELWNRAVQKVPEAIDALVIDVIKGSYDAELETLRLGEVDNNGGVYWYDPETYSDDQSTGPYMGYDTGCWKLDKIAEEDTSAAGYLYAYLDEEGKSKKAKATYLATWKSRFTADRARLKKRQILVPDKFDDDEAYLAVYSLGEAINSETLIDADEMKGRVAKAVADFTKAVAPLLRK